MAQYIDKDTLMVEIKKYYEEYLKRTKIYVYDANYWMGKADAYRSMLEIIDTIEVKEVDLEKEIKEIQREYKTIEEYEGYPYTMYANDIEWIAKHFFELGLSSQLTWRDIRLMSEIGEKFMNSEKSDHLSEEEYYTEILNRFKAQKGE